MKKIYKIAVGMMVILAGLPGHVRAQFELLYVTKPENAVDIALMDYLYLEGYSVTEVAEDDFKAEGSVYATEAGYAGYDVLFVSESIGSSSANNFKNAGFPIPCVSTEGFAVKTGRWDLLADDSETFFRQASSTTSTADVMTLVITDNNHWITQDFETNDQLNWAESAEPTKLGVTAFNLGEDIAGATPLANILFDMGGLSSVWAIPEGSVLHDTYTLPNMVLLGLIQTDVGQTFTGELYGFLVRCIRWVSGDYVPQGLNHPKKTKVVVGPNPTAGPVHVTLSLSEAGDVWVNLYDMAGRRVASLNRLNLSAGSNTLQLDFSDMVEAAYVLELVTKNETLKERIILE